MHKTVMSIMRIRKNDPELTAITVEDSTMILFAVRAIGDFNSRALPFNLSIMSASAILDHLNDVLSSSSEFFDCENLASGIFSKGSWTKMCLDITLSWSIKSQEGNLSHCE